MPAIQTAEPSSNPPGVLVRFISLLLCLLSTLLMPGLLLAQGHPHGAAPPFGRGYGAPRPPSSNTSPLVAHRDSVSAAVRRVERATGGQVLNVESMRFQGRDIYRLKVLGPGGRVSVVVDDPSRYRRPLSLEEFNLLRDDRQHDND